jgi:hypothetical protein
MHTAVTAPATPDNRARRAILLGGFSAGLADFLFATIKAALAGKSPLRPWKGVASGLLGQAGMDGGAEMAVLGVALHFFIAIAAAALLYLLVSRVKWIPRQWLVLAVLYGVAFLAVMNYVILPLSAIGVSIYKPETLHINAFWHVVLIGLPTSWFVTRGLRSRPH